MAKLKNQTNLYSQFLATLQKAIHRLGKQLYQGGASFNFTIWVILTGGPEGSRTPVRKSIHTAFFERSLSFGIPLLQRRQTGFIIR